jgi:hypothetical protein
MDIRSFVQAQAFALVARTLESRIENEELKEAATVPPDSQFFILHSSFSGSGAAGA